MINIKKYFKLAVLSSLLLTLGCSKSDIVLPNVGEGEAILSMNFALATTKASVSEGTDAFWANSELKLYKETSDGSYAQGLIKVYSPATDMPDNLQLLAGNYKAVVRVGALEDSFTDQEKCCYIGQEEFTLAPQQNNNVTVDCKLQNSVVNIVSSNSLKEKFNLEANFYLSLKDSFDKSNTTGDITFAASSENKTAYFSLDENQEVAWGFVGRSSKYDYTVTAVEKDGVSVDDGALNVVYSGKLSNLEKGKLYSFSFSYDKTPDGGLGLVLGVETVDPESTDSSVDFAPQPSVKFESGSFVKGAQNYENIADETKLFVESLTPLKNVVLNIDGIATPIFGDNAEAVDNINYESTGEKSGTITVSKSLYDSTIAAASAAWAKTINIVATDQNGSVGKANYTVGVEGFVETIKDNCNLWSNRATLKALYFDSNASEKNMVFSYKKASSDEWIDVPATLNDGFFCADIAPSWTKGSNEKDIDIYTPSNGIFAGNSYDYKLSYSGSELWSGTDATAAGQSIPYGDLNDSNLSCWGNNNTVSNYWASGNNSNTPSLCKQSSSMAKLSATEAIGILAAGNLMYGQFVFKDLAGTVHFGQPFDWSARPKSFKFDYAATKLGTINCEKNKGTDLHSGDQDIATVYMAIVDWGSRRQVKSGTSGIPVNSWSPISTTETEQGKIIGYAYLEINKQEGSTALMIKKDIPIVYYNTDIKPSKNISLVISAATSKYGDYMVGCSSNELYLDNFAFGY